MQFTTNLNFADKDAVDSTDTQFIERYSALQHSSLQHPAVDGGARAFSGEDTRLSPSIEKPLLFEYADLYETGVCLYGGKSGQSPSSSDLVDVRQSSSVIRVRESFVKKVSSVIDQEQQAQLGSPKPQSKQVEGRFSSISI